MNTNERRGNEEVAERNVQRLLESYEPIEPPAQFAQRVRAGLHRQAELRATRGRHVVFRLGWSVAAAGMLLAAGLTVWSLLSKDQPVRSDWPGGDAVAAAPADGRWPMFDRLVAKPIPPSSAPQPVAVGAEIATTATQRRRVALPDGSTLFVNASTRVKVESARRLAVSAGEVFVAVARADRDGARADFTVATPTREVIALGTKFAVKVTPAGTGVAVTHGRVKVSGLADPLDAGRQLAPGRSDAATIICPSSLLAWTRDLVAVADTPMVPANDKAGGALIAVDPNGQEVRLTLRKYHVDVYIDDGFARTTIDQTYFNEMDRRLEGTFYFPLPADASLSRLAMYVEGRLMEGGMAERQHARNVYETILYQRRDPALLEWLDGSTFRMRVFPLEGRQEKRIIISYTQKLGSLMGRLTYRFPAGHSLGKVNEWSFHALVRGDAWAWQCNTHELEQKFEGGDLLLDASARDYRFDSDVVVTLDEPDFSRADAKAVRFDSFTHEGSGYLMLRYRPSFDGEVGIIPRRDWMFLVETSADRDPLLARTQIEAMRAMLANAQPGDRFAVVAAATRARAFADEFAPVSPGAVKQATEWLEKCHLIGALDLDGALIAASKLFAIQGTPNHPTLVHLGSGVAVLGERSADKLVARLPGGVAYVGVAVGRKWDRGFMKLAAARTGGYFTQVNPDQPVSWRAVEVVSALNSPRLLNVRVTDTAGQVAFLAANDSIVGGEELCAIARLDSLSKMPKSLVVTASRNGKPYSREILVGGVKPDAGYLPRQWARLEIDRLVAENAEANKVRIIELSKASYVMSPFTSLLVLENEEMYKQFNVDRGRKDHWAMYPAPERIPVVHEPRTGPLPETQPATDPAKSAEAVLRTVMVHTPPRWLYWPGEQYYHPGQWNNAWDLLNWQSPPWMYRQLIGTASRTITPDKLLRLISFSGISGPILPVGYIDSDLSLHNQRREADFEDLLRSSGWWADAIRLDDIGDAWKWERNSRLLGIGMIRSGIEFEYLRYDRRFSFDGDKRMKVGQVPLLEGFETEYDGQFPYLLEWKTGSRSALWTDARFKPRLFKGRLPLISADEPLTYPSPERWRELVGAGQSEITGFLPANQPRTSSFGDDKAGHELAPASSYVLGVLAGRVQWPTYQVPYFTGDTTVYQDLLLYAPGMRTGRADLLTALESEGTAGLFPPPGRVDPKARELIDKARSSGWVEVLATRETTRPDEHPSSSIHHPASVFCDGSGRMVVDRMLANSLREKIVCDGKTLLQLYPELGLGSRRTVSRFHRAGLTVLPWQVSSADDLAAGGADVVLIAPRTVEIRPHPSPAASGRDIEEKDANSSRYFVTRLVFSANGQLSERRIIEQPAGRTIARTTYAADGLVTVFNEEGKELARWTVTTKPAAEPDLSPDTKDLVVLPMPGRSNLPSNGKSSEDVLAWISGNLYNAISGPIGSRFIDQGDRRIGLYVLMFTAGHMPAVNSDNARFNPAVANPDHPLTRYMVQHAEVGQTGEQGWKSIGRPKEGFIQRLAEFRYLHNFWNRGGYNNASASTRQEAINRAVRLIEQCGPSQMSWALLQAARNYLTGSNDRESLLSAMRSFENVPGLAYFARYESARLLTQIGRGDEAAKAYRELLNDTIDAGVVPVFDYQFYSSLNSSSQPTWAETMRDAAGRMMNRGDRPGVACLAWQCRNAGDQAMADELLRLAVSGGEGAERILAESLAIQFHVQTGQIAQVEPIVQRWLADPESATSSAVWRMAAGVSSRRGRLAEAARRLDKAVAIEFADLPEKVNLQAVSQELGGLLAIYGSLADATAGLAEDGADNAHARRIAAAVVRSADRWRMLAGNAEPACRSAAVVLNKLGNRELAWEYLTSPLADKPHDATPWANLATTLQQQGELELAERALAAAFDIEPTDAQKLWDRALLLEQIGRGEEAKRCYRQLAEGTWQLRFEGIKSQAKRRLGN